MHYVFKVCKGIGLIYLISLIFAFVRGFSFLEWINVSFLASLAMFAFSAIYYLNAQGAYTRLGHSMKKFYYAIVELFSNKNFAEERRKIAEYKPKKIAIYKESEMTVASVVVILLDIIFSYAFYC